MLVSEAKKALRHQAEVRRREARRILGAAAGEAVRERFLAAMADMGLAGEPAGRVVAGYWPMADEIDLRPLLARLYEIGFECALPVVTGRGRPLVFRRWTPATTLRRAGFGLSEPGPDAPEFAPEVLLVPLLAFDVEGYRLGHGAGYYDITLAALRHERAVLAVGVAFAAQEVARVPRQDHDQRLDWIVTEERATPTGVGGGRR